MIRMHTRWLLPLSFFLFISYIIFLADTSSLNLGLEIVRIIPYGDKVIHALLYGMMAMFLNYGLGYKTIKFNLQLGATLVLIFAILEELSQYYIPSRTLDIGDLLADFIGVVLFSIWRF